MEFLQGFLEWAKDNTIAGVIIALVAIFMIFLVLYLTAKGKLNFMEGTIKELILKAEKDYLDVIISDVNAKKLADVLKGLREVLPKWVSFILSDKVLEAVVEAVFAKFKPKLKELIDDYLYQLDNN